MSSPAADLRRRPRILIAGLGLLTPLGLGAWPSFTALLAGRSLCDRAATLPHDIDAVSLVRALGGVAVAQHTATDPAVELAERAAREAALDAGINLRNVRAFPGTSKGAVHALTRAQARWTNRRVATRPLPEDDALAVALGPHGYLSHHLTQRLKVQPQAHHVAACASSLTALHAAKRWLESSAEPSQHQRRLALVLTAEAALLPQFIHSYRRLGVLAPLGPGAYRQRPLDEQRQGFMLSEMGAAVVLERLEPGAQPAPGQIELIDTATAADGRELIRPTSDMPGLRHVAEQLFAQGPIDVLHPHAPGTPEHDPAELNLCRQLLADRQDSLPDVYACKGALGHSLGTAGLSALIIACLCARTKKRPPMPWLTEPMKDACWPLNDTAPGRPCPPASRHAIFAAGFGGHVAGALIQAH